MSCPGPIRSISPLFLLYNSPQLGHCVWVNIMGGQRDTMAPRGLTKVYHAIVTCDGDRK